MELFAIIVIGAILISLVTSIRSANRLRRENIEAQLIIDKLSGIDRTRGDWPGPG